MGKFVGWKCDVCNNAEDGNDAPVDWLRLRLPSSNGNSERDTTRDFCSDKCLLKFSRERVGGSATSGGYRANHPKVPGLSDFLAGKGVKPAGKGVLSALHVKQRHEMNGGRDDCLVCEFLTGKESVSA